MREGGSLRLELGRKERADWREEQAMEIDHLSTSKQLCRRTLLPSLPRSLLTWQIEQLDLGVVVNDVTRNTRQRRKFVRGRLGLCWREGRRRSK